MQEIKKDIFLKLILIIIIIPISLRFLIKNQSNKFINNLYFNTPILLTNNKTCPTYEFGLKDFLDETISITIVNQKGQIIYTHNGSVQRIPASNLKLFSTGYVISKNNTYNTLKTSLYRDIDNNLYLVGSGDPDLTIKDIKNLFYNYDLNNKFLKLYLVEIKDHLIWPDGWTDMDKLYEYGSPITTLALNSNSKYENIIDLKSKLKIFLKDYYRISDIDISIYDHSSLNKDKLTLINQVESNPIISLITLANSESHNFTAESLFKNSSETWNTNRYIKLYNWLKSIGLPVKNSYFADGSGLSRKNRVTTNLTALFLYKMQFNDKFDYFSSSMSILGVRGTLAKKFYNTDIEGNFIGKTGTLSNVFALSGYLFKNDEFVTVSIIQNSNNVDNKNIFNLLSYIFEIENCI